MTLAEYEALTGTTVATSQIGKVTAQLARVQSNLEVLLGYPLTVDTVGEDEEVTALRLTNHYDEVGKTDVECFCANIDFENLEEPDEVEYAYRLFPYNSKDNYLHVDPFTTLGVVKLVHDGVTVKTFNDENIRVDYGKDGVAFYIELCKDCLCTPDCGDNCVQVAVDADWAYAEALPLPLQYLIADMVEWQTSNKGVVSQTVLGHSYTLGDEAKTAPENKPSNLKMLQGYAGYYGTVVKRPTI